MAVHKLTREATDRYADVNGVKIHYNEAGQGPALLCFHGGGPGANAWDNSKHNVDALSEHFRMLLVDLPGYGYSDKDAKLNGEPLDCYWARVVRDLMDQTGIERAHLYGSSQSGPMCLRFGIEYPDRVGKIILQSSGSGGLIFTPSPAEGIKALAVFAENPTRENMAKMMHLFVPRDELCSEEMIDARFQAALIPGHLEARREFSANKNSDLSPDLPRLQTEVLVVWGHQDRMVPVEGAFGALWRMPNVRVHIWGGGTGHFVEYEHADEFNRLVVDFITH
jgi:pimeloyl-ACP methyl ester carboxylesterase